MYTYQYLPIMFLLIMLFSYLSVFSFLNLKIEIILIKHNYKSFFCHIHVLVYNTSFFPNIPIYSVAFFIIYRFFAHQICISKHRAIIYMYYIFLKCTSNIFFTIHLIIRLIVILTKLFSCHYSYCMFSHAKLDKFYIKSLHSFRVYLSDKYIFLFFQYRLLKCIGTIITAVLLEYILNFRIFTEIYANLDLWLFPTQFFPLTVTLSSTKSFNIYFPCFIFLNIDFIYIFKNTIIHND
jgi:hypothetical protein